MARIDGQTQDDRLLIVRAVSAGLVQMREEDVCTDFNVVVQGESFRCHKVVLASVSDYFLAMFTSGMKETIQNETVIDNITPETFKRILDLLYELGRSDDPLLDVSDDMVVDLLRVSDMLQMNCVAEMSKAHLSKSMSASNCMERWLVGKSLDLDVLVKMSWDFAIFNFEKIVSEKVLRELSFEDIVSILKDENLEVQKEANVWRVISEWINFDMENREDHIVELLRHCCLTEVDSRCLTENIAFHTAVRKSNEASDLVHEAICFRNHPSIHGNVELKYRKCTKKQQVDVVVGVTEDEYGEEQGCLNIFDSTSGELINSLTHSRPMVDFACCVHGNNLYVSGGEGRYGKHLYEFSGTEMTWHKLKGDLPVPLRQHTMAANDRSLFAISGSTTNMLNWAIFSYPLGNNAWARHGDVVAPVRHASAACLNDRIYIIGGLTEEDQSAMVIQEYDINNSSATIIKDLPKPCKYSQTLARMGKIYTLTSDGDIFVFEVSTAKLEVLRTVHEMEGIQPFGIAIRNNQLKVFAPISASVETASGEDIYRGHVDDIYIYEDVELNNNTNADADAHNDNEEEEENAAFNEDEDEVEAGPQHDDAINSSKHEDRCNEECENSVEVGFGADSSDHVDIDKDEPRSDDSAERRSNNYRRQHSDEQIDNEINAKIHFDCTEADNKETNATTEVNKVHKAEHIEPRTNDVKSEEKCSNTKDVVTFNEQINGEFVQGDHDEQCVIYKAQLGVIVTCIEDVESKAEALERQYDKKDRGDAERQDEIKNVVNTEIKEDTDKDCSVIAMSSSLVDLCAEANEQSNDVEEKDTHGDKIDLNVMYNENIKDDESRTERESEEIDYALEEKFIKQLDCVDKRMASDGLNEYCIVSDVYVKDVNVHDGNEEGTRNQENDGNCLTIHNSHKDGVEETASQNNEQIENRSYNDVEENTVSKMNGETAVPQNNKEEDDNIAYTRAAEGNVGQCVNVELAEANICNKENAETQYVDTYDDVNIAKVVIFDSPIVEENTQRAEITNVDFKQTDQLFGDASNKYVFTVERESIRHVEDDLKVHQNNTEGINGMHNGTTADSTNKSKKAEARTDENEGAIATNYTPVHSTNQVEETIEQEETNFETHRNEDAIGETENDNIEVGRQNSNDNKVTAPHDIQVDEINANGDNNEEDEMAYDNDLDLEDVESPYDDVEQGDPVIDDQDAEIYVNINEEAQPEEYCDTLHVDLETGAVKTAKMSEEPVVVYGCVTIVLHKSTTETPLPPAVPPRNYRH